MGHPLIKSNEFLLSQAILGREILRTGVSMPSNEEWNSILFTGGTGFIGGFLLKELLENTKAKIYCLIRCDNERQGKERLVACMQEKGIWKEKFNLRISVIKGDLNLPQLGLSHNTISQLAERIDVIYHLGASVNWASNYTREAQANVLSFIELLKLAITGKVKPIHYSSSMGTYASSNKSYSNPILENEVFLEPGSLFGGYCQTKWVCEKLVEQARMRNIPINLYRIGEVNGDSNTGLSDLKNFINLFMGFCIMTQMAPESYRKTKFNLVPVDYVAKAMLQISKNMEGNGKNFQFNSRQIFTLEEMVDEMNRCGFTVRLVSDDVWENALKDGSWLAKRIRTIFKKLKISEEAQEVSLFDIGQSVFLRGHDTSNTDQELKGSEVACGKIIDDGILHNYLNYILKNI
jgi:thioester reductase-like protein